MKPHIQQELVNSCLHYWQENLQKTTYCLSLLTEQQVWQQPNTVTNCIGNLILHLCGNISQYILATVGEKNFHRNRNAEFENKTQLPKAVLLQQLNEVIIEAGKITAQCPADDMLKNYAVQIYEMSGIAILIHVTEHFSYHAGQIVLLTKQMTGKDLGFYASLTE
ncbi:DinB family protein [Hydrotalea sp.]|uniref:DinB family protein n=1 Tax=Hydrotalea sp. TaxID=2881279 RepID=UPI002626FD96|nr:DinB family protein [Hydrotalea sp.]